MHNKWSTTIIDTHTTIIDPYTAIGYLLRDPTDVTTTYVMIS